MAEIKLTEQEKVRRKKMQDLQDMGIDPFGQRYDRTATSGKIIEKYDSYTKEELQEMGASVKIAGRIMTKRRQGKAGFMHIQDIDGQIQIYVRKDEIGEEQYEIFKKNDIGDIVGIEGTIMKTDHGQLSVRAKVYTHLSKALRPLPEKWHGLVDIEACYRQRYLDLIMNNDTKKRFILRTKMLNAIRAFLTNKGFLEVETPILLNKASGALARPFVTHHNALDIDMYLRIATELNLKRLIVGGYDKVYEIGRIFRNEGMDIRHNPEFTSIELYEAYSDYNDMMNIVEELFSKVSLKVLGTTKVNYQGQDIDLAPGWKRISMIDSIKEVTGIDFNEINTDEEAVALAKERGIEIPDVTKETRGDVISLFFDEYVEKTLEQPTFIYDYPIEISPLAKKKKSDPRLTERFEAFIGGREYGNAFSELNDPIDQYERFKKQVEAREAGDDEAGMMDEDFIQALEIGLPPTGGLGIGIDRFVMLLTDAASIRDVLLFPTMKPLN